jgi:hypothetical protein
MIMSYKRWLLLPAIVAGSAVYLWASSPGRVVVSPDGSITGAQNDLRLALQGQHFWVDQRYLAQKELALEKARPERDRALRVEIGRVNQEFRQSMEQFYRENPSARPSGATAQAEALRDLADKVEQAELDRMMNEFRLKRIAELEQILALAEARLR